MIRNFSSALIASASLSFSTANFLHTPFAGIGTRDSQQSIRLLAFSQPISFYRKEKVNLKLFHHRDRSSSAEKVTLESFAEKLKSNGFKRILVVVGAGVSCSAGIPDFRTPGSGLYDNLHKFNLPYPEAIFDLEFYKNNPQPFVTLAKEIWPGVNYRLLDRKGLLLRVYTQNIDGLEEVSGVHPDRLVECHGHFRSASCTECRSPYDPDDCKTSIVEKGEAPTCSICGGIVKVDVTFFGEELPSRFSEFVYKDVDSCDLLMVVGTSLLVAPVAYIPEWVTDSTPRLLVNRELVGDFHQRKLTDLYLEGDCDDSVRQLCKLAGWENDLDDVYLECLSN